MEICSIIQQEMAWTARSEDEKKEYFDSPEELEKKVSQLAEWVKESKHMIIFTVSALKAGNLNNHLALIVNVWLFFLCSIIIIILPPNLI